MAEGPNLLSQINPRRYEISIDDFGDYFEYELPEGADSRAMTRMADAMLSIVLDIRSACGAKSAAVTADI